MMSIEHDLLGEITEQLSLDINESEKIERIYKSISTFKTNMENLGPFFLVNLPLIAETFYKRMGEIENAIYTEQERKIAKHRVDSSEPPLISVLYDIATEIESKSFSQHFPSIVMALIASGKNKKELIKLIKDNMK